LTAYISETIRMTTYGCSYVVNLFEQKVVSHENDIFDTVILHNNLFCHRLSDHLHCTNRPFTFVLRKVCLHSLADQNVHRLEIWSQRNIM